MIFQPLADFLAEAEPRAFTGQFADEQFVVRVHLRFEVVADAVRTVVGADAKVVVAIFAQALYDLIAFSKAS
jgi:hypothetical protein